MGDGCGVQTATFPPYALLALVITTTGCPEDAPEPYTPTVRDGGIARDAGTARDGGSTPMACAPANAQLVRGDFNGDGLANVADAVAIEAHLFRAGPAPVCSEAADFNRDTRLEADDATTLTTWLTTGGQVLTGYLRDSACDDISTYWPSAPCAPLAWIWLEPSAGDAPLSAKIRIAIDHPTVDVQGWSTSIGASGCTIDAITTEGTVAAEVWDEPPGLRHLGYNASLPVEHGAISYVIMSFSEPVVIAADSTPTPVLELSVSATACGRCQLGVIDGLSWTGEPIDSVIVANGVGYRTSGMTTEFDPCSL
jgi:hypothetical protein